MQRLALPVDSAYEYVGLGAFFAIALLGAVYAWIKHYRCICRRRIEVEKHLDATSRPIVKPHIAFGVALVLGLWLIVVSVLAVSFVRFLLCPNYHTIVLADDEVVLERYFGRPFRLRKSEIVRLQFSQREITCQSSITVFTISGQKYTSLGSGSSKEDAATMKDAYDRLERFLKAGQAKVSG